MKFYLAGTGSLSSDFNIITNYLISRGWIQLGEDDPFALDEIPKCDLFILLLPCTVDSYIKLGAALSFDIPVLVLTLEQCLLADCFSELNIECLIEKDCYGLAFTTFRQAKKIISNNKKKEKKYVKSFKHRL